MKCESTSAEYLTNKITQTIQSLSLDKENVRGQAYDGAVNMAGARSGVGTRIKGDYPKAMYLQLLVSSVEPLCRILNELDGFNVLMVCREFRR